MAIQLYFLERFCAAWYAGHFASLVSFETVDDTAFADVGVADQSHSHCPVGPFHLRKLLDELDQVFCSDGFGRVDQGVCHDGAVCDGLFVEVEGREVGALRLEVGFEHDHGVLSSEVGLPGVGVFHRHEVDLVQNQNYFLVRQR